jgi:hypothetical protein
MKVGERKSVALFTNGKFGYIPTPKNARAGMVIYISYNRKKIVFFAVLAAFVLAALLTGAYYFKAAGHRKTGEGVQNERFEENRHGHSGHRENAHD